MAEKMVTVPSRFIVYCNQDVQVADPYSVIFPDGQVFLFGDDGHQAPSYLCSLRNFKVDVKDEEVFSIPESLLIQILKHEV